MKILMINVVCGIRSTGRICTDLATALEAQGHDVKIAYGRENVPDNYQKYAVRIGSDLDVKLHALKARLFDGCGWGSVKATKKFIDWIIDYNPDVIHLHNIHGYYINIELLFNYLKICNKKIIWTLHDSWAFTGHSAYCDVVGCERWKNGCYNCPNKKIYPKSLIDRSKVNWLKKKELLTNIQNFMIITPSEWLANLVKKSFLYNYETIVIHNGIDTSQFCYSPSDVRNRLQISDTQCMLLGVSTSWDEMKGLSDYFKLANLLGEEYQIVLVGLTKSQINGLPHNIIGIERTNSVKELAELYSACDIFLNLSYCENYPTVNLEALACGATVITYNVGGSSETVRNVDNGYTIDRGDINAVKNLLIESKNLIASQKLSAVDLRLIDKKECVSKYLYYINEYSLT